METAHAEIARFTKQEIESLCGIAAKGKIVQGLFIGEFGAQEFRWAENSTLEVITHYIRGSWDEISVKTYWKG